MKAAAFAALAQEQQMERLSAMAQTCVGRYGLSSRARVTLLNLSENATFLVQDDRLGRKSILRIHRPGYHSDQAIRSELKWLKELDGHLAVCAAQPIAGSDGEYIQVLDHSSVPEPRHAVMFAFLQGREPDPDDLGSFERLGVVTAHLHEHAQNWPDSATLVRHTWDLESMFFDPVPRWGRWQDGIGVRGRRAALLEKLAGHIRERLTKYGKTKENFGLIHADLRLANLLVHEGRVQVIDFDDCGYGWYVYDLASALSFVEDRPQVPDLVRAWMRGYRSIRPLAERDEAEIPTFIMARRLLLVAWVGSHQEAPFPRQLGEGFTEGTCRLAERLLSERGMG